MTRRIVDRRPRAPSLGGGHGGRGGANTENRLRLSRPAISEGVFRGGRPPEFHTRSARPLLNLILPRHSGHRPRHDDRPARQPRFAHDSPFSLISPLSPRTPLQTPTNKKTPHRQWRAWRPRPRSWRWVSCLARDGDGGVRARGNHGIPPGLERDRAQAGRRRRPPIAAHRQTPSRPNKKLNAPRRPTKRNQTRKQ